MILHEEHFSYKKSQQLLYIVSLNAQYMEYQINRLLSLSFSYNTIRGK